MYKMYIYIYMHIYTCAQQTKPRNAFSEPPSAEHPTICAQTATASICFCFVSTCKSACSIFQNCGERGNPKLTSPLTKPCRLGHLLPELKLTRPLTQPCRLGRLLHLKLKHVTPQLS